jgi:2-C-methyl-D-erythritol 4-phosphate cytidylyltransferase
VEQTGVNINLISGSYQNIKITYPEDVAIAEFLLRNSS